MSDEEMKQDFREDASRDRLPIRLVAFESNKLVGTIILREHGSMMLLVHQGINNYAESALPW